MVFKGFIQQSSRFLGSDRSILSINVTNISSRNTMSPGLLKCLYRCSCMQDSFLSNFLLISQSISKIVRSFPIILFLTMLACQEIYETYVITVQLNGNFKGFSSHSTSKCVSISHIITNLKTILALFLILLYGEMGIIWPSQDSCLIYAHF